MAKALVGYRVAVDPRRELETVELRRRVRDLEALVDRLQRDNDRLREDQRDDLADDLRQPDVVAAAAPTIAG
jgi:predicted secreted Zn-dependent protease